MCLAVPGRIEEIYQKDGLKMAQVDFGGVQREVCLDYVPEAQVGEYCIIHVGFAISLLSEAEAKETLALLQEIDNLEDELEPKSGNLGIMTWKSNPVKQSDEE